MADMRLSVVMAVQPSSSHLAMAAVQEVEPLVKAGLRGVDEGGAVTTPHPALL